MTVPVRRIVTGHDPAGGAVFQIDEMLATRPIPSGDAAFALLWTTALPADNNDPDDGAARDAGLTLHGGSVLRVVDMRPGHSSPMHRSHSTDYGIVLSGGLELRLDGGETRRLGPGDIVVQRGTNHLWHNPSRTDWCRIVFVLIEAGPVIAGGRVLPEIHP